MPGNLCDMLGAAVKVSNNRQINEDTIYSGNFSLIKYINLNKKKKRFGS